MSREDQRKEAIEVFNKGLSVMLARPPMPRAIDLLRWFPTDVAAIDEVQVEQANPTHSKVADSGGET